MDTEIAAQLAKVEESDRFKYLGGSQMGLMARAILQLDQQMTEMRDHRHLVKSDEWLESVWTTAEITRADPQGMESLPSAATETPPSETGTTQQEGTLSGESISSETFSLVRVGQDGRQITLSQVTFPGLNLTEALGKALSYWHVQSLSPTTREMWESLWRSGATPSTPEAPQDGPSAGTKAATDWTPLGLEAEHAIVNGVGQSARANQLLVQAQECIEGRVHRFFPRSVTLNEPIRLTCIHCETKMDIVCLPASTGKRPDWLDVANMLDAFNKEPAATVADVRKVEHEFFWWATEWVKMMQASTGKQP